MSILQMLWGEKNSLETDFRQEKWHSCEEFIHLSGEEYGRACHPGCAAIGTRCTKVITVCDFTGFRYVRQPDITPHKMSNV